MSILDRLFKKELVDLLDNIRLDGAKLKRRRRLVGDTRVWYTPEKDQLILYCTPPPELPTDADSVGSFCEQVATKISRITGEEFSGYFFNQCIVTVDECPAIHFMTSNPADRFYSGTLIIPFQEITFNLQLQCRELGITGIRETALAQILTAKGEISWEPLYPDAEVEEGEGQKMQAVGDFDPDDEKYDADFPDHPLSRLRRRFPEIVRALRVSPNVKDLIPLALVDAVKS